MTHEQRERLEEWAFHAGAESCPQDIYQAIAAALADLDACRAALRNVASKLSEARNHTVRWSGAEIDAVLAAAGGEKRP